MRSSAHPRDEAERRPSPTHLHWIGYVVREEVHGPFLPVRRSFIAGTEDSPPPLSWLLPRAGLDAVQLKTLLLVLAMAAYSEREHSPVYEVPYEAETFARALDLPDVRPMSTRGARRVRDAVRKLEQHGLLQASRQGSRGPRTALLPLKEDGSGEPYENPAGRKHPKPVTAEGNFIQVPHKLLANGWLSVLSGAALTTWLVLRTSTDLDDPSEWFFVSPAQRDTRYHVSHDTYLKGLRELEGHGLVERRDLKKHVGPGPFDWARKEHLKLVLDTFEEQPWRALLPETVDHKISTWAGLARHATSTDELRRT